MEKPVARDRVAVQVRDAFVIVKVAHQAPVHQLPAMVTMHISIPTRKNVSKQTLVVPTTIYQFFVFQWF